MAEATHTSEAIYGLRSGVGRGAKLWAGFITVSDGETIDTGLDTIEGISGAIVSDADIDANTPLIAYSDVTGGIITFLTGEVGAYTNVTDATCSLLVVGAVR